MSHSETCLFVASSDNTWDVFTQVAQTFPRYWPDCPYRMYVGLNTPHAGIDGFTQIHVPVAGWRRELLAQIEKLPNQITHVLLFLDDFLLMSKVDNDRLQFLVGRVVQDGMDYLRLTPLVGAWLPQMIRRMIQVVRRSQVTRIPEEQPYVSSLQVSVWRRRYLESLLKQDGSIWDFEHQVVPGGQHYAISADPPIPYRHVVEKGKWCADARTLFEERGLRFEPGNRKTDSALSLLWVRLGRLKFHLLGYSGVRARRAVARMRVR